MTDEELQARITYFNQTLLQYGRQKTLYARLESTWLASELNASYEDLRVVLQEIQVELEKRREQALAEGA